MALLPYLSEVQNPSKKYSVVFRGLNYGEGTQDGEFSETYNLSSDQYPCITQRAERIKSGQCNAPTTLHAKGELLVIDGEDVIYGKKPDGTPNIVGKVTKGKKQTATVGNYIVIFPDKKYYKVPTEDDKDGEFGDMEATFEDSSLVFSEDGITRIGFDFEAGDTVIVSGCKTEENNKEATITEASKNKLTFVEGTFVNATEDDTITFSRPEVNAFASKVFFACDINNDNMWHASVRPVYNSDTSFNAEETFKVGDVVAISGCETEENNRIATITKLTPIYIYFAEEGFKNTGDGYERDVTFTRAKEDTYKTKGLNFGTSTISKKQEGFEFRKGDAVIISGCDNNANNKDESQAIIIKEATKDKLTFNASTFTSATENALVTIKRPIPDLDFICENNYRLWGTHDNTICSSKFSDPLNFRVFEGLAGDSYSIDVGSEGEFTGCIPYSSHICFFKENTLHKLYGTKPSNFQINTVNVYGVQKGSERSMQIVNEQLLYKGVGGVYAYTGGVPELISEKFGNKRYSDAVACCDGERYYISMRQGDKWSMFAYDVAKNIWLREDETNAVDMAFHDGKVYFLDANGGLYYIDKTADRNNIEWGATFCTINETINERKGYSKFHLRMDLSAGAWLAVDIKTDNDTQWRQVYTTHNEKAKTVSIPILPTRCDSIDIRLRGKGKCTIKAFIREFSVGSDV